MDIRQACVVHWSVVPLAGFAYCGSIGEGKDARRTCPIQTGKGWKAWKTFHYGEVPFNDSGTWWVIGENAGGTGQWHEKVNPSEVSVSLNTTV